MRQILTLRKSALGVLVLIIAANIAAWGLSNRPVSERPWAGAIAGVSFSPYQVDQSPHKGKFPSREDIARDLDVVKDHVLSIRTYSSTNGLEQTAPLAAERGIAVTAGAYLYADPAANEAEIAGVVRTARENKNVKRVIVGNEAILHDAVSVPQLIEYIQRVRRQVNVPVSTGEPWHVWLDHPELAQAVDFITVHLWSYWEGKKIDEAVDYAMQRYAEVKAAYPNKHILIGEIGWPSEGPYRYGAEASQVNQAKFIRNFLNVAGQQRLDYYICEAFDQAYKRADEGAVGGSWGIWDSYRNPKFPMDGGILEMPSWPVMCAIATIFALLPIFWFVLRRTDIKPAGQLFYGLMIQTVASVLVWTAIEALTVGMGTLSLVAFVILITAQLILLAVMLIDGLELTEVVWTDRWKRRFAPVRKPPEGFQPKVSIHVPCYNEPPHMVIETLDALSRMDYPNFEVLVLDNNTKDEAVWRPIEEHCRKLGPRFRFFHLPKWPGYKAGALNFGIQVTAPDSEIIGVIDSDYQVTPDWLSSTVPYFESSKVAFVQSPQDYREWSGEAFKTMINWEYQGFFHIGMIQRNERNAIIQHGTMTLIRKDTLKNVGWWAEWCICEDAELGLRLFEEGYESIYMPDSFGQGLVPDSFAGYKTQRFRWAYGAVQILKRHWREMLPGAQRLTAAQKYHFITGWLPWFADAAHMAFVIGGIFWTAGRVLLPSWFELPPTVFILPTLSVFFFKVLCSLWLYEARVKCRLVDKIAAAIAGMALTHTVGRAVWQGLFTKGRPFVRTPKCEDQPAMIQGFLHAREEVGLMLGLWAAALAISLVVGAEDRDSFIWAGMLLVQSTPYLAALFVSILNSMPKKPSDEPDALLANPNLGAAAGGAD